jgi:hypothetical protein
MGGPCLAFETWGTTNLDHQPLTPTRRNPGLKSETRATRPRPALFAVSLDRNKSMGGPCLAFETWGTTSLDQQPLTPKPHSTRETQVSKARPGPPAPAQACLQCAWTATNNWGATNLDQQPLTPNLTQPAKPSETWDPGFVRALYRLLRGDGTLPRNDRFAGVGIANHFKVAISS